jgi:hypothetical protein
MKPNHHNNDKNVRRAAQKQGAAATDTISSQPVAAQMQPD